MQPTRVRPDGSLLGLLAALYPTVRWKDVTFHDGIPAVLRIFTQGGITFPDPLGTRGIRIYVARWDPDTLRGLALLVHEAFHVLQYQEALGGVGLGPLRAFAVKYLLRAAFEGGGERNAYEAPAYAHERAFLAACLRLPAPLFAGDGTIDPAMQHELLCGNPSLIRRTSLDA